MGHDDGHWLQDDPRWSGLPWYIPRIQKTLLSLTCEIQCWALGYSRSPGAVLRALEKFNKQVNRFVERPAQKRGSSLGTLSDEGCLILCYCNLLKFLGISIQGEEPTPPVLLEALQDEYMLTLTGFCAEPGVDLISIVTEGAVSVCKMEDYGRPGVRAMHSEILRNSLTRGKAAIVNTVSHAYLSARDSTHFVVVTRRVGNNFEMRDPGCAKSNWLLPSYKRIFGVSLYRWKRKRKR